MHDTNSEKAFVLGLDGVPWNLLQGWRKAGELENFQRLATEGAAGPLESSVPATTPLAWPSIATGTRPDKHGIYGFHRIADDYTHRMYTGADRQCPALWDIITPAVAGNIPMTYPAGEIDGAMVSGMMTPDRDAGFTEPNGLKEEIEREIPSYRIELDWYEYTDNPDQFLDELADLVDARQKLMHLLATEYEWRLFFFVFTAPDRLQHLLWDEDRILEHYRRLDDIIGEAMEYAAEANATLYVVSDHGFGPIEKFVNLNTVLAEQGFLTRKTDSGARQTLSRLGITKDTVLDSLDTVGITPDTIVRYLPTSIVTGVANQIPGDHGLYDVDFDETIAFAHDPSQIYINDTERFDRGIVPPSEVPEVKQKVETALSQTTDPGTNSPVLDVRDGDDLFPTDSTSPDLIAVGRDEYEEKTKIADEAFEPATAKAAGHRSTGIFFAWGPDVTPGTSVEDATVVDVAPTVLYGAGEPIPSDSDGRVLDELFASRSSDAGQVETVCYGTASTSAPADDGRGGFADVEDRLRGLGYLE